MRGKITLNEHTEWAFTDTDCDIAKVTMKDGTVYTRECRAGGPGLKSLVSRERALDKYRQYAPALMVPADVEKMEDILVHLEDVKDIADVSAMMLHAKNTDTGELKILK